MTVSSSTVHTAERPNGRRPAVVQFPPNGRARDKAPPPVTAGEYGADGRAIYRRVPVKDDDGKPQKDGAGNSLYRWETVLRCDVRFAVDRRAAPDPDFGETTDAEDLPEASSDVEVTLPGLAGSPGVTQVFRNMATSELRQAKFLDMAGRRAFLGLAKSPTQATRGELFIACNELSEAREPRDDVFYTVTGWHSEHGRDGGRPFFVTGSGAIGADGYIPDVVTQFRTRELTVYAPQDAPAGTDLLDAFDATADLLGAMPGRIMWPLVAARLRAVFGVYRDPRDASADHETVPIGNITGNTGAGKSGLHAATGNVLAPGLRHNTIPFKCGSPANGGVSGPGMENLLYKARDLPTDWDDLDPNEPEDKRAAWQSLLIRRAAGQQARVLARRTGGNRAGKPCRAGVVMNGEPMDAQQSAENRAFNIEVGPSDIRRSELRRITGTEARGKRSELGGGVIRAIAADRPGWLARLAQARIALRPLFAAGEVPGAVDRGADCFAEEAATWFTVLQILRRNGMTARDARAWWQIILTDLREAWFGHLAVIGRGSRSARALGTIQEGISSGVIALASARNPARPPENMRFRRGWTETMEGFRAPPRIHGYIDDRDGQDGDLLLLPRLTAAAVRSLEASTGSSWTGGVKTLAESLRADGALTGIAASRRGAGELTDRPKLGDGDRPHVWRIPAARLDTDDDGLAVRDYSGPADYAAIENGAALDPDLEHDGQDDGHESVQEPPEVTRPARGPTAPVPAAEPVQARTAPARPVPEPRRPGAERAADESAWRAVAGPGTRPAARQPAPPRDATPYAERLEFFTRAARKTGAGRDADPADIRRALDVWELAMRGLRFTAPGHLMGIVAFHWLEAKYGAVPELPRQDAAVADLVNGLKVRRAFSVADPAALEAPAAGVTGTDVNAQFANAGQMAELGTGTPEWLERGEGWPGLRDGKTVLPGYVSFTDTSGLPGPFGRIEPGEFITTQLAQLLPGWAKAGRCELPEIGRALVWREHRRWLRLTCRRFLDGRDALKDRADRPSWIAVAVLKRVYSQFLGGMLASGPGRGHHNRTRLALVDWRDMVRGQAMFGMWYALGKADPAPAAVVDPDAAYFLVPEPGAAPSGLVISDQPGKWKIHRACPVNDEIRRAIAAGRATTARNLIRQAHEDYAAGGAR
jgi:hypothetical protein